jgi:hypothetical protein
MIYDTGRWMKEKKKEMMPMKSDAPKRKPITIIFLI